MKDRGGVGYGEYTLYICIKFLKKKMKIITFKKDSMAMYACNLSIKRMEI